MTTTEHEPPVGDRRTLMERFIEAIKKLFHKKNLEEWEEEAKKAEKKRRAVETKRGREEEEGRREREEKQREVHKRGTAQKRVATVEEYQLAEAEEVTKALEDFLRDFDKRRGEPGYEEGQYAGAGYLYDVIRDNRDNLIDLIWTSPQAAEVLKTILNKRAGVELHAVPAELVKLGQRLIYEANKAGKTPEVAQLMQALKARANDLVRQSFQMQEEIKEEARKTGRHAKERKLPHEELVETLSHLTPQQRKDLLQDETAAQNVVNDLLTNPVSPSSTDQTAWIDDMRGNISANPTKEVVDKVAAIESEIELKEKSGYRLTPTEIEDYQKQLVVAETTTLPKDIIASSTAYDKVVVGNHEHTKRMKDILAAKLAERLREELPEVKTDLSPEEFLEIIGSHPGHFGGYLEGNPNLKRLLWGDSEKSIRFRNQVFLTIHSGILTSKHRPSQETFGLYERADFISFLNILRSGMADRTRPKTSETFGQTWIDWYSQLSETISQCRDIDYWASQPGADIENFQRSLALFKNEYFAQAMTIPAVEQAFRLYQTTLRSIQAANDGYIPPGMVDYSAGKMSSEWDNMTFSMLRKLMAMGVVHDVARDEYGFHELDKSGRVIELSKKPLDLTTLDKEDPQHLETYLYLTLAKGLGVVSFEYTNMFANSKVPGSDHPDYGMGGFHSMPYEGIARAGNYFNTMIEKWKFGNINYFFFMNQLLPTEKKLKLSQTEAVDAYIAYRNDVFQEHMMRKYGLDEESASKLKRLIDLQNFSKNSAAWGPPYTQWRHYDSTLGWKDEEKSYLGASSRVNMAERYAKEKVKEYLVEGPFREKFREQMKADGRPYRGPEFDRLWQEYGKGLYDPQIEEEWDKIQGKTKIGEKIHHHHLREEAKELTQRYIKAFNARVWIETAMRNPLAVAHNVYVEVPIEGITEEGIKTTKKMRLHSFLVHQILGIPLEDTKYGIMMGATTLYATPTGEQTKYIRDVADFEGDIAVVREIAVQGNRNLEEKDFDIIKDKARREQALKYWQVVKQIMLGSLVPEQLYEKVGLPMGEDRNYAVNWQTVKNIDKVLDDIAKDTPPIKYGGVDLPYMLTKEWTGKEWEHMFGLDDMALRQTDILNLGSRQLVRRGGDWHGHYIGGQKAGDYLTMLVPNPDPEELAKALLEMRRAYEEDMIEVGWRVAGIFANATCKLYSWDNSIIGSPYQVYIQKTRRDTAAWMANGRRKFWDEIERKAILPPTGEAYYYDLDEIYNIHALRKSAHAEGIDVWLQIITLGLLLATLMTIYRALTAKSEEGEEGGGGGGGHH